MDQILLKCFLLGLLFAFGIAIAFVLFDILLSVYTLIEYKIKRLKYKRDWELYKKKFPNGHPSETVLNPYYEENPKKDEDWFFKRCKYVPRQLVWDYKEKNEKTNTNGQN